MRPLKESIQVRSLYPRLHRSESLLPGPIALRSMTSREHPARPAPTGAVGQSSFSSVSHYFDVAAERLRLPDGLRRVRARTGRVSMRVAAYELGISRVVEAGRLRRHRGYV
jgi:hypothetical protein